jgi:hypothetical protein
MELIFPYLGTTNSKPSSWWFGDEYERFPELRFIPIVLREDTSALWQRGDMDGFTVILGLVREAEAIGDTDAHIRRVADRFLNEPTFRAEVNRFLPAAYRLPHTMTAPDPSTYRICFAIMSKEHGPLELPFFSKVSLRYAVKNLRRMGFKTTKLKINR